MEDHLMKIQEKHDQVLTSLRQFEKEASLQSFNNVEKQHFLRQIEDQLKKVLLSEKETSSLGTLLTNQIANAEVDIAYLDKILDENDVKEQKMKENIGG